MFEKRFLTVEEVATRLHVGRRTVRRWLRQGRLQGIMPGGLKTGYRIPESELERFIAQAPARPHRYRRST